VDKLPSSNRRGTPRLTQTLDIRYRRNGGGIQAGQAINISLTGARLRLDDFPEDPELTVEFEGKLAVLARAVWHEPLPDGGQLVGVVFEGIHWGQRVALDNYLYDLECQAA